MDPARRRLLFASAGGGTLAAVLAACGGGSDYSPPPTPPPSPQCNATAISGNHGHSLTIPPADLDSQVQVTYSIEGTSGHVHMVTLQPAQFAQIKGKSPITVTATLGGAAIHSHDVTINCA